MTAHVERSSARDRTGVTMHASTTKLIKKARNFVRCPDSATSKQLDGAEDVKRFDYVRREDGFAEAGQHRLSEGDRDDVQRARRCHATPCFEGQASPSHPVAVCANADPTNGVADVSLAAVMQQLTRLQDEMKRSHDEMKRDVAELKLQRNDHSVKAGPEVDEETLRRMCHGIVDNVARRLSQRTTASRVLGDTPVIDYVPDASNEKRARDEVLRESDDSDGSQEHRIAGAVDLHGVNQYEHSDANYVENGQDLPFRTMRGVIFKKDKDDVTRRVSYPAMWEVVDLCTTRKDGREMAQTYLNGRFKLRSGNNRIMYYTCTSHEDCKCCYRVSFSTKQASWVVAKRDYLDHEHG